MKTRPLVLVAATLSLGTAGLHAEFKVDALVTQAARNTKDAPALISKAAVENPKSLSQIVSAAVTAFPEQATEIVAQLLKVAPKQASEIVRGAIQAQPTMAVELASVAMTTLPGQAAEIMKTAIDAAPADLRNAVASLNVGNPEEAQANPTSPSTQAFPQQSMRPELVTPVSASS